MKRFGKKLRTLRLQHELTMRRLSDILGVSDSYISKMETGDKTPNVAMLLKICDLFGISCDKLIRDELELD